MPFDLALERICDHRIFDESLTLQGASPNYFALLRFQANLNTNAIEIREFAATEGSTNYSYTTQGFTNWTISSDGRQINFNTSGLGGPGTGVAAFADGQTLIQPAQQFMITYLALDVACPLHNQAGPSFSPIQKDINITEQGTLETVVGTAKVRQAVLKTLLTVVGTNPFNLAYGSLLSNVIGQKFDLYTQFNLQQSVQSAVDFLIQQQQLQPAIPANETILRVSAVNLDQDPTDPRTVKVNIRILTASFEEVTVTFGILT